MLEVRPGDADADDTADAAREVPAADMPRTALRQVRDGCAAADQLVGQSGQQFLERAQPAGLQPVRVLALRDAPPVLRLVG